MVERGVGSYQIGKAQKSEREILKTLQDGKWHRYQELVQLTKLSQPTLSKHLKKLEEGIVERKLDTSGSEYPYPVFYRIKPRHAKNNTRVRALFYVPGTDRNPLAEDLTESDYDCWVRLGGLHSHFEFMNEMLSVQILLNLLIYFEEKNEEAYEQSTQLYVISVFEDALRNVKAQLEEVSKRGEDVSKIINDAMAKLVQHYDVWYQKSRARKRDKPSASTGRRPTHMKNL
jgi:DNA-binding transcriptional ArsR family regulator